MDSVLSLVAQLAWPARNSIPQLSFDVSDLPQRSGDVSVGMLLKANNVLRRAQELAKAQVDIKFYSDVKPDDPIIGLVSDASFGGQPGGGSQSGYAICWGPTDMITEKGHRSVLLDWGSPKI